MYLFPLRDCEDPVLTGSTNYIPQYGAQKFGLCAGCGAGSRRENGVQNECGSEAGVEVMREGETGSPCYMKNQK